MPTVTICGFNVEWMNDWFTPTAIQSPTSCCRPGSDTASSRRFPTPGRVRHAEYDAQVVNGGANREDRPSDHRPVSVELDY